VTRPSPAAALFAAFLLSGCAGSGRVPAPSARGPEVRIPSSGWDSTKQARHALERLAFGPLPGEAEEVARTGVGTWIRGQMEPERIENDAVDGKLRDLPTLAMTVPALLRAFPRPQDVAKANGIEKNDPEAREKLKDLIPPGKRPAVIDQELTAAKLVRAVESRRQLQEILVDFWFNHFNVSGDKGEDRWMVGAYEREAIRPFVFGCFRDLLEATASHPAMLFYLDNWTSTWEGVRGSPGSTFPRRGINENYARELMELHTLGVDGGYTQKDVREVARCFTGWSIVPPRGAKAATGAAANLEPGTFVFRPRAHDPGEKRVLGTVIPASGGRADAELVLDLLARHPSTARFVATKLCRRFVSDDPPAALVARVASVFTRTGGDLRFVYAEIFSSPEFWSDAAYRSKTKTPLELAASAVRALGGRVDPAQAGPLARQVASMGEPLYKCQPPTGWGDTAAAWVGSGTLMNRVTFCAALAAGKMPGVAADPALFVRNAADPVRAAALVLGGPDFQRR
jgi:uncharacterized protein (DUF1800 family)